MVGRVVNEVPAEEVTAELLRIAAGARQAHAIVLIRDYASLAA